MACLKQDFLDYLHISKSFFDTWSKQGITGEEWKRLGLSSTDPQDRSFFFQSSTLYLLSIAWIQFWRIQEKGYQRLDRCRQFLEEVKLSKTLDYGSGIGGEAFQLSSEHYWIHHYDINALARDFVRYRNSIHKQNLIVIDPWELLKLKGEFDLIFCFNVLDNISNWRDELEKIRILLSPQGTVIHHTTFGIDVEHYPYHFLDERKDLLRAMDQMKIKHIDL